MSVDIEEVQNLRTDIDILLDDGVIIIQARDWDFAWRTKTENSCRRIPIVPALREILDDHVRRGFAGERYFIRTSVRDAPVSDQTVRMWTMKAFAAAGIKYGRSEGDALTFHSTRHTAATWLLSKGATLPTVAKFLGDTKEQVLKTYAHAMPHDEHDVRRILEAMATKQRGC